VGKGNDGPVQPRACTFLLLFPASCPVSLVLFFQESQTKINTRNIKINKLYIIVVLFSLPTKREGMPRGNSQSRLRDSILMGCGPFARISFTSLSFPGLPVTNTVRVKCLEGGGKIPIPRVSLRDYADCRGSSAGGKVGLLEESRPLPMRPEDIVVFQLQLDTLRICGFWLARMCTRRKCDARTAYSNTLLTGLGGNGRIAPP
jgi:hypothetical protein